MTLKKIKCILAFSVLIILGCAHLKDAKKAYSKKDYQKTIQLCKRAIKADSTDIDAHLLLAQTYLVMDSTNQGMGLIEQIRTRCQELPNQRSKITRFFSKLGNGALDEGRKETAITFYQSAEMCSPQRIDIVKQLAELFYQTGKLEKAKPRYEKCLDHTKDPTSIIIKLNDIENRVQFAKTEYQEGLEALKANDLIQADHHLTQASKAYPGFTEAAYFMNLTKGKLQYKEGDAENAIQSLKNAIKVKFHEPDPHFWLARAYEMEKPDQLDRVIKEYQITVRLAPRGTHAPVCQKKIQELKERKKILDDFWGN